MRHAIILAFLFVQAAAIAADAPVRPRIREAGVIVGILPPGPLNAITDVAGVRVGHTTLIRGETVRTGVTVILPHGGNLFREKVPAAVFCGNAFGKLMGSTQIEELGELESPIALTSTLNVARVADALIDHMLALPGNEEVRSINVVVGETNDGRLNDIRGRHVGREEVFAALKNATGGVVEEGSVGAGTGTVAFGWKGGIGTASRKLPAKLGGWTVGVLVQTNYGGVLTINGAPVGQNLGQYYLKNELENADGSIMIVIATDAPLDARNLKRMGARAMMGLARTGAAGTNGSGDYAIAFSTARNATTRVPNDDTSPLFLATIEATEEAIYNSLFRATAVRDVRALPLDRVIPMLRRE
ncbi:MAG TPA: P1 family peptidase [Thermoanaerobaculia bacterium]|nr:P1 family peptidase [Thermoanaerobaculia bacterium]